MAPRLHYWLCALETTTKIISNVKRRKLAQCFPSFAATTAARKQRNTIGLATGTMRDDRYDRVFDTKRQADAESEASVDQVDGVNPMPVSVTCEAKLNVEPDTSQPPPSIQDESPNILKESAEPAVDSPQPPSTPGPEYSIPSFSTPTPIYAHLLQSSKVPSSRIGRLFHYGGLAASLGYGATAEFFRRTSGGSGGAQSPLIMSEANIRRLVSKLSKMRGAALKVGQFLSIQDTHSLPPEVDVIFRGVLNSAHYMPDSQLNATLTSELGKDWESYFASFDRIPFAAASIGQVHSATLLPSATTTYPSSVTDPIPVAVKVQFPGIRRSISSDLSYIRTLLHATKFLPKGLFLDRTIEVMGAELADECSYKREAFYLQQFREWLGNDKRFKVPWVWEGSTEGVLVIEKLNGVSLSEAQSLGLSERDRVDIAAMIIELCFKEILEFQTMQADPNWTNFLWNPRTRQIELVDFGATRTYSKSFVDDWYRLAQAVMENDRDKMIERSIKLGYLTGEENNAMIEAFMMSTSLLMTPFRPTTPQPYRFGPGSEWEQITTTIRSYIPVMLNERLTPPPKETYSLNRKLSGALLLMSKLDVALDTRAIWENVTRDYRFGED